jgi:hypothetical protein
MVKFTTTTLRDGTLEVGGPATADPGMEVKHLRFVIAQGDVMVEDDADSVGGGSWTWTGSAGDLQPGAAYALGLAVMFKSAAPASLETVTWFEPVTLTA